MPPASSSYLSDSRLKWKKQKRDGSSSTVEALRKQRKSIDEYHDAEYDEEEDDVRNKDSGGEDDGVLLPSHANNLRQSEVLSESGQKISDFPLAFKRSVIQPHSSVLAVIVAEKWTGEGLSRPPVSISLENISHGQSQVLSSVLPDSPLLNSRSEMEKLDGPPAYVCTPPALLEGKGDVKRSGKDGLLVLPQHSDWFNMDSVHRLERQVVPHFFAGKSVDHTPERYITLRNRVVEKYLENPRRKLSFEDCQDFVSSDELFDLSRIVRFLDHWGIINFMAVSKQCGPSIVETLIREENNGDLTVSTAPLKSIDSLMQFDRPRSIYRLENFSISPSATFEDSNAEAPNLDGRIRELLSEHSCKYCLRPLVKIHYQSQKEDDTILCSNCFHDGKFVIGHSSLDFVRMDFSKDLCDHDGESWTDQETFFLLEALEIYGENWNEISEHVGTKSKAQCILHFIRLPMESSLLENIEIPQAMISNDHRDDNNGLPATSSNGDPSSDDNSGNRLPFANATNSVMSLVAFLAAAVGPRVAAACANAALSLLTKEDPVVDRMNSEGRCTEEETLENQGLHKNDPISPDKVKSATMFGLSAAAIKSKLFADQEEREIQRITAAIINHQLKRLELKLKQFAEIETLLLKECEQVERTRQRLSIERVRLLSSRYGQQQPGTSTNLASSQMTMHGNPNNRQQQQQQQQQQVIPLAGQANMSSPYGNAIPIHPSHMPFMARQPLYPFVGPRLPLSAIHPSSSPQPSNVMLSSGDSSSLAPNSHHPLLRSIPGSNNNNTNLG